LIESERLCFDASWRKNVVRKVLIVDDSVSMRQMVSFTLRQGGFEVIEAEHGQDALNKLASVTVDLIITDLNMPVMDGITLIQNARKLPSMKGKPILMLTTEGLASKKEQGKAAGATGWIVKPFAPEKLLATLAKVLP
jgi:two-component system, chemotaxis family, chemotaxis protein CheY